MSPIQPSLLTSAPAETSLIADIVCAFQKAYPDLSEIQRLLLLCQNSSESTRAIIKHEIDRIEKQKCEATPHSYRSMLECLISGRHYEEAAIVLIKLNVASIKQANQHYAYTSTGMTPLHLAAKENSLPIV